MSTVDLRKLKESVNLLDDAAFQAGKAQSMDMRHRNHFQGLHDEARSIFLDQLISLSQEVELISLLQAVE